MQIKRSNSRIGILPGGASAGSWIEANFRKCECIYFAPTAQNPRICGCGRDRGSHVGSAAVLKGFRWRFDRNVARYPTDAYGTIKFRTGVHANYVRMSPLTTTENVVNLLIQQCGVRKPELIISIHSSLRNFDLPHDVKRSFRQSIQRMAMVPGCWIITTGLNIGGAKYIGDALTAGVLRKTQAVVIGIVPWGVVAGRHQLCKKNADVEYIMSPKMPGETTLNPNHSVFLLVDDGSIDQYGHETEWRRKFEKEISSRNLEEPGVPLVSLFLDGGAYCLQLMTDYLSNGQPLVAVGGSGRASEMLSEVLCDSSEAAINRCIEKYFADLKRPRYLLGLLHQITYYRSLITVWQVSAVFSSPQHVSGAAKLDICILRALLKAKDRTPEEQFKLALAWNRSDLATKEVLRKSNFLSQNSLEGMMMDALSMDRVEFVELLLERVSMESVITYDRLEQLYNINDTNFWLLRELINGVTGRKAGLVITLEDIGATIDALMSCNFRSSYKIRGRIINAEDKRESLKRTTSNRSIPGNDPETFEFPFSELMTWAIFTQRQDMAMLLCIKGRETLANCCVAFSLCKAMTRFLQSRLSADLEMTIAKLKSNKNEFGALAIELLDHCHKTDEYMTQQLLTHEICNFSDKTCLSLASAAHMRHLVAHPSSQKLIDALWMGGLRARTTKTWMVLLGVLLPPYALFQLHYLSQDELKMQPHMETEDGYDRQTIDKDISTSKSRSKRTVADTEHDDRAGAYSIDVSKVPSTESMGNISASSVKSAKRNVKRGVGSAKRRGIIMMVNEFEPDNQVKLRLIDRVSEFYNAPVTKYWIHAIGYLAFISCYCYTILTELPPDTVEIAEIYCDCYVFALLLETIRQILTAEGYNLLVRIKTHFSYYWNAFDAIAIILYIIGFSMRFSDNTYEACKAFWIFAVVFFLLHVFDIFQAFEELAIYVTMMTRMLQRMISFTIILAVVVFMYGIVLQSSRFPFRQPDVAIMKDIWIEPFMNLFGETYHELIDTGWCSEDKYSSHKRSPPCWCCTWIGPVAQTAFLIVANILMLNLLIAIFNSVYIKVNRDSQVISRFQRYRQIIDFKQLPILPPPFILFSHVKMFAKYLYSTFRGYKQDNINPGLLKLVLNENNLFCLYDFEEQARDEIIEQRKNSSSDSNDPNTIQSLTKKVEGLQGMLETLAKNQKSLAERISKSGKKRYSNKKRMPLIAVISETSDED